MNGSRPGLAPWELLLAIGLATQLLKFFLYGLVNRRVNLRALVTTNGMPSLHAVVLSFLSIMTGLDQGFRSPLFITTFLFTGIVLHDLIKIQGSVGRGQATGLFLARQIETSRGPSWIGQWARLLSDRGHRPLHVGAGMLMGILAAIGWGSP